MARDSKISIVVPVLNEASGVVKFLAPLQSWRAQGHEVVLVDGGSTDRTLDLARPLVDQVQISGPGRALQMNTGARASSGNLLLFLHADTYLPSAAYAILMPFAADTWYGWGRFDVRLAGAHPLLRVVETLMNLRSRLTGIATGDQALFISRTLFEQIGGFAPLPLMEDIELSSRLRRLHAPQCLHARVETSARRWVQDGVLRTITRMWWLRWLYFCGVAPATLAARYRAVRELE
jgi:rSAM/selenodomain-associated transferase 2